MNQVQVVRTTIQRRKAEIRTRNQVKVIRTRIQRRKTKIKPRRNPMMMVIVIMTKENTKSAKP
jgi:hypothetical protein